MPLEVFNLVSSPGLTRDAWTLAFATDAPFLAILSQYFWLLQPHAIVWWHLADESLPALVEAIEKMGIPSIRFVKCPRLHANAAFNGLINQHKSDL